MATTSLRAGVRSVVPERRDLWWLEPLVIVVVLGTFVLYSVYAGLANANYFYEPYLSPLYSPCITANCVHPHLPIVGSYWKQWRCLFPQHGPGKKHSRQIELVDWQREIVERCPGALLRGLIHSDGWRGLNRVFVKGRWYEYPRYQFSNRSADIRRIFTDACDICRA